MANPRRPQSLLSRLYRYRTIDPHTGCWLWTGAKDTNGYGRIKVHGQSLYAHRVSYEQHRGAIPSGLVLDHTCKHKQCFNPAHLEPVTSQENNIRGIRAITERRIEGHPRPGSWWSCCTLCGRYAQPPVERCPCGGSTGLGVDEIGRPMTAAQWQALRSKVHR